MFGSAKPTLLITASCLWLLGACLFAVNLNAWGASAQAVVESLDFAKRYQAYTERTANRPVDQLNAYLDSGVEDVFLDGSKVSPAALTAEVRYFKKVLFKELQLQLCRNGSPQVPSQEGLKLGIVRSSDSAARASAVNISYSNHGRIAGIVANIIQQTKNRGFCRRRSFSDLE